MVKSVAQYNCTGVTSQYMDNTNHYNQPYHQTRSRMKTKTYGSSYKCHQCRVPLLMVAVIVAIELLLFTNVSHCANAKSYVLHWNTSNPLWVDNFSRFIARDLDTYWIWFKIMTISNWQSHLKSLVVDAQEFELNFSISMARRELKLNSPSIKISKGTSLFNIFCTMFIPHSGESCKINFPICRNSFSAATHRRAFTV